MKRLECNVAKFMGRFVDYRSVMDSIHGKLMEGILDVETSDQTTTTAQIFLICNQHTALWIRKLSITGAYVPKEKIIYDGLSKNCIGLLDGHEVCIDDTLGDEDGIIISVFNDIAQAVKQESSVQVYFYKGEES